MCKEAKRLTPFEPKVLTAKEKEEMQMGVYHKYKVQVADEYNRSNRTTWTDEHKQAWELAQMDRMMEA